THLTTAPLGGGSMRCEERKLEDERGALARLRVDPDLPVHPIDELAADVQTQTCSPHALGHVRIEAVELLKDPPVRPDRDAAAFVADAEAGRAVLRLHA